tara:strand:+ start:1322 stop:2461 length:1140 start_codon:yes stop_codon:yes gene_type:complete
MENNNNGSDDTTNIINANDLKVVESDIETGELGEVTQLPNPRIRCGFNNQGQINLDEFEKLPKIKFKDATFIDFDWLDLTTVDLNSSNYKNIGIRTKDNVDDRIDSFRVSFSRRNYDMSEFPPCIDTDGAPLEGRGRIRAAILNGERWMPVARYSRADAGEKNTITNGLIGNQFHNPTFMNSFDDYVCGGVGLVTKGLLAATSEAIDDWLYNDVKIANVYDNSRGGTVTKIRNTIIRRASIDDSLIWSVTKSEAEKWITTNLGLAKSDFVLVNMADNETYAERAWRHVRDALKNDREPVTLIFYTTDTSPTAARTGLKKSMEYMENLYLDSWEVVKSQLPEGISLAVPKKRPYIFKGALPQIVQDHNINGHNLVPVNKY